LLAGRIERQVAAVIEQGLTGKREP
jgi:hypothetical protein